jgi:hypothetical protein
MSDKHGTKNQATSDMKELELETLDGVSGGNACGGFDFSNGNKVSPTTFATPFQGFGNPGDDTTPYGTYQRH